MRKSVNLSDYHEINPQTITVSVSKDGYSSGPDFAISLCDGSTISTVYLHPNKALQVADQILAAFTAARREIVANTPENSTKTGKVKRTKKGSK